MLVVSLTNGEMFDEEDCNHTISVQAYGVRVYDWELEEIRVYPWHRVQQVYQKLEEGDYAEI